MTSTARFLLLVLLTILGIKASEQVYRAVAFRDERAEVRRLRRDLAPISADLLGARAEGDSLRRALAAEDRALGRRAQALRRYNRIARHGRLPADVYAEYRAEAAQYDSNAAVYDALVRRLEGVHAREHAAITRYNLLADSIHALAARMGRPYYEVPSPLEAAAEAGELRERQ
ncbi:MAG TPA: hypothetical protein VFQ45_23075 [Longimicrobium sp.]|nr:hypothetical protein [Longimicrobium sp.]